MLIVCPSCASEYTIDSELVRADGRTVRCAACRGTWFVAAPSTMIEEPRPILSDGPLSRLEVAGEEQPALSVAATNARNSPEQSPPKPIEPWGAKLATKPGRRNIQRGRRFPTEAALAALALAFCCSLVLGRAGVVQAFPATARLYAAVGLPMNLRGLVLNGVRAETSIVAGATLLALEGEIENVTGAAVSVPRLEIAVRDGEGQTLYTWTNEPPKRTLDRAERAPFRARLASPPAEGRHVLVRFAPPGADEGSTNGRPRSFGLP